MSKVNYELEVRDVTMGIAKLIKWLAKLAHFILKLVILASIGLWMYLLARKENMEATRIGEIPDMIKFVIGYIPKHLFTSALYAFGVLVVLALIIKIATILIINPLVIIAEHVVEFGDECHESDIKALNKKEMKKAKMKMKKESIYELRQSDDYIS